MAKFKQALKWMKEGKKVRRPRWMEDSYWIFGPNQAICWLDGKGAYVHLNQILADDWEIYKEPEKENLVEPLVKKSIMVNGVEYKIMRIGAPTANDDIRYESSWYTKDPRKQEGK